MAYGQEKAASSTPISVALRPNSPAMVVLATLSVARSR